MKRQSVFIASLAALLAWAPAQSQEFKFATQNPKGHPLVTGMERFAEIVAARTGGKIKGRLQSSDNQVLDLFFALGRSKRTQVKELQRKCPGRRNDLYRGSLLVHKGGAQYFVPLHDPVQRRLQRSTIERAPQT